MVAVVFTYALPSGKEMGVSFECDTVDQAQTAVDTAFTDMKAGQIATQITVKGQRPGVRLEHLYTGEISVE